MPSLRDTAFRRCIWSVFASIGCVSEASDSDTRDVCVLGVYRERVSRSSGRDTCIVQSIERVSMCSVASDHDTCILRRIDCVSMYPLGQRRALRAGIRTRAEDAHRPLSHRRRALRTSICAREEADSLGIRGVCKRQALAMHDWVVVCDGGVLERGLLVDGRGPQGGPPLQCCQRAHGQAGGQVLLSV